MLALIEDVDSSGGGTQNSKSCVITGEAIIEIPEAYDGTTTVMGGAVAHIQRKDDAGWEDAVDGNSNELMSAVGQRRLKGFGEEYRVQLIGVSGTTDIPRINIYGEASKLKDAEA